MQGLDLCLMLLPLIVEDLLKLQNYCPDTGLLIFRGKKSKISRDFQEQIRGKIGRFHGIFAGKRSKFMAQSADFGRFLRERSQNSRKIGPFRGILAEKSQFSKDFQRQILRKISRFHGKFRGETSPRNNQ